MFLYLKRGVLAVALLLASENVLSKESEAFSTIIPDLYPWSYTENGNIKGIVYEIIKEASLRAEIEIEPRMAPQKRVFTELALGNSDFSIVISSSTKVIDQYSKYILVGKEELFDLKIVAVSLKSKKIKIYSPDQLDRFHLGGISLPPGIQKELSQPSNTSYFYANGISLLKSLLSERIDLAISSSAYISLSAKELGVEDLLFTSYKFDENGRVYIGWSRKNLGENTVLYSKKMDTAVRAMKEDGTIFKIIRRYSDPTYFENFGSALSASPLN